MYKFLFESLFSILLGTYLARGGIAGSPPDFLKAGTPGANDGQYLSSASPVPDHRAERRVSGSS